MIELNQLTLLLLGAAIALMVLDWLVILWDWRALKWFSKPMVMVVVFVLSGSLLGWQVHGMASLLFLAQIFGLLGDIFLMFRGRWFLAGLGSFLVGHFFYIGLAGFFLFQIPAFTIWKEKVSIIFLLMLLMAILVLFNRVFAPALHPKKFLWRAVKIYASVLSLMMVSVFGVVILSEVQDWLVMSAALGGILFLISDFLLAYDRFIVRLSFGRIMVRITYHLGQLFLALGFCAFILIKGEI